MVVEKYNNLKAEDKHRFAWQIWNTYCERTSEKFNIDFYHFLYGTKRFMVDGNIIRRRDSHIFNHEIILNSNIDDNKQKFPENFPITYYSEQFKDVDLIEVRHTIEIERFWWLPFPLIKGTILQVFHENSPYPNVSSNWGIKCKLAEYEGYYEIPLNYVSKKY
jgi:hypothetical protein